jgi:hypothetical protein
MDAEDRDQEDVCRKGKETQWSRIGESAMHYRQRGLRSIVNMATCCSHSFEMLCIGIALDLWHVVISLGGR